MFRERRTVVAGRSAAQAEGKDEPEISAAAAADSEKEVTMTFRERRGAAWRSAQAEEDDQETITAAPDFMAPGAVAVAGVLSDAFAADGDNSNNSTDQHEDDAENPSDTNDNIHNTNSEEDLAPKATIVEDADLEKEYEGRFLKKAAVAEVVKNRGPCFKS
ncbi:MAG: hypothetical protein SGILL_003153 [Bacillariaceae sp.]